MAFIITQHIKVEAQNYLTTLFQLDSNTRLEQLEEEIAFLFHHNLEHLMWILYRLDVNEQELYSALQQTSESEEKVITRLLLQRCQKMVETRKQFNNSTENWSFDLEEE